MAKREERERGHKRIRQSSVGRKRSLPPKGPSAEVKLKPQEKGSKKLDVRYPPFGKNGERPPWFSDFHGPVREFEVPDWVHLLFSGQRIYGWILPEDLSQGPSASIEVAPSGYGGSYPKPFLERDDIFSEDEEDDNDDGGEDFKSRMVRYSPFWKQMAALAMSRFVANRPSWSFENLRQAATFSPSSQNSLIQVSCVGMISY